MSDLTPVAGGARGRAARLACALAALLALGGCSTVGDMYDSWFGSRPTVKPAPLAVFKATAQPRIAWRGEVGPAEKTVFFPAVTANQVYAAGASGQIVGFEVSSGKVLAAMPAVSR